MTPPSHQPYVSLFPPTCSNPAPELLNDNFTPTPPDVFAVRITLLHFVPTELANMIITAAEYWPKLSASRTAFDGPAVVSGKHDKDEWCYLASAPLPNLSLDGVELRLKVTRVRFTVNSCYEEPECEGLQSTGSDSWLEAAILTSSSTDLAPHPEVSLVEPTFKDDRRWHIRSNPNMRSESKWYDVVWDASDSAHTTQSPEIDPVTNSGTGRGFIPSLSPGDRVAVMTRDLYRGWVNCIYTVKLEVYYAV